MVITRNYAAKYNIKLYEGLPLKKKKYQNNDMPYIFKFLILIWVFILIFTTSCVVYNHLFRDNNQSLYNFIITDLPEKTILNLYNNIPARPYNELPIKTYNYIIDILKEYNIDYF